MNARPLHLLTALCIASTVLAGPALAAADAPEDPTATVEYDGETLTLASESGQTVRGTTNLDSGTDFVIEIQSIGDEKYNEIERATVDADGTFETTFDLSRAPETGFLLTVLVETDSNGWTAINGELRGEIVDEPQESATIDHEGDALAVEQSANATIGGETSLDAGSELVVRIRSTSTAADPFLKPRTVEVSDSGTFEAEFDLGDVPVGTEFTVSVRPAENAANELAEVDGTVVEELTSTTSTTERMTTSTDERTESVGQPGFGVAVALLALVVAAFVVVRRS